MVFTKSFPKVPNECFQMNDVNNENKNKKNICKMEGQFDG